MAKTIIKELMLLLLICLAIILILGIVLYKYVPTAKPLPNEVSYITPSETKTALSETKDIDESQIIMTYEVNASDLNNFQRIQDYKPGKSNPFSTYETPVDENEGEGEGESSSISSTSSTSGTSSSDNQSSESTSGGRFFQNTGTK